MESLPTFEIVATPDNRVSTHQIYRFRSDKLSYTDGRLIYTEAPDMPIRFDQFLIPVSPSSPKLKSLADDIEYSKTALAMCDLCIRKSKNNSPRRRQLFKAVAIYWKTILFLRGKGVYYLKNCTAEDLQLLCKEFAIDGWVGALKVHEIVSQVIRSMDRAQFEQSIYLHGNSSNVIDCLSSDFWLKHIGIKVRSVFNEKTKKEFESKAADLGYTFSKRWSQRWMKEYQKDLSPPTDASIKNFFTALNNLYYISNSVDKIAFLPYENTFHLAKKLALRDTDRTGNINLDTAVHVLGKSIDWIYKFGPKLISVLRSAQQEITDRPYWFKENFLSQNLIIKELADELCIPLPNSWAVNNVKIKTVGYAQSMAHLIGALQGACAVAIAAFNARRSSEVCSKDFGVRVRDLKLDKSSNLNMVNFYIEKSYQERHLFYVNQVTSDAIALLIQLKKVCMPKAKLAQAISEDESIFHCHGWTSRGPKAPSTFVFSNIPCSMNSLQAFISFLDRDYEDIDFRSHMWRRFFALIYIYRYDHSNIQSLSQHLRHMGISQTMVYLTDTNARKVGNEINSKIPQTNRAKVMESRLINSLNVESNELNDVIQTVRREKFDETIASILKGNRLSGGFPRLIRKLYQSLSKELNFSAMPEHDKAGVISSVLISREYECTPMPHGQCNAPNNTYTFYGKCSENGRLKKERASAEFCQNCMFHSKNEGYVKNLREEILMLEEDIQSDLLPDIIRDQAIESKNILIAVIELHEDAAERNSKLMQGILEKNEKKT